MRLVINQDDDEIARRRAERLAMSALRTVAANLMRVTRGSGKPEEIVLQLDRLVTDLRAYREISKEWPSADTFARALDIRSDKLDRARENPDYFDESIAQLKIVRAALGVAAAQLLGQATQISTSNHELYAGATDLRNALDEQNRRWAARSQKKTLAAARALASKPRKPKPGPKA